MAELAQGRAHQRGLARAEVPLEVDDEPRLERVPEGRTERDGGGFVGKISIQRYHRRMEMAVREAALEALIKQWGREIGFDAVAIAGTELAEEEARLVEWLGRGWHGG